MLADKTHRAVCAQIVRLLREERERQGISKYAMAERSGLSEQMIGYVERSMRQPSREPRCVWPRRWRLTLAISSDGQAQPFQRPSELRNPE